MLRGLYTDDALDELQRELEDLQRQLVAGELPEACGTVILDDPDAMIDGEPFAHYVCEITPVSARARAAVMHPGRRRRGAAPARPARLAARGRPLRRRVPGRPPRRRLGLLAHRLALRRAVGPEPRLVAVGRVHDPPRRDVAAERLPARRARVRTSAAPTACRPGSRRCPARSALYCDRGDVLFHHSDLWHSAARATDDGEGGIRRHVRGGWYGGTRPAAKHGLDDFVKNARR